MPSLLRAEYKVVYPTGAKCREHKNMSSRHIVDLPMDTIVTVEKIDGRRCKISSPMKGWVSLYTTNGQNILLEINQSEGSIPTVKYAYYAENRDVRKKTKIYKLKTIFNKKRKSCYNSL
eukprot:218673_1